ncbi:MAG: restriction endonuclease [bacterium]|nr:restriction endonuclease [bacterium]
MTSPRKTDPEWLQFEAAVAKFIQALDPKAEVEHNVRLPDRDTQLPRQRDVWVKTTACGIFPVSILISCKRLKEKINQQDMDAFWGELRSSGATMGVVYSYSGFTAPAIEKAKALGVTCCQLLENQPPTIPEMLLLRFYCCTPTWRIGINKDCAKDWASVTLKEALTAPQLADPEGETALEFLINQFNETEKAASRKAMAESCVSFEWEARMQINSSIAEDTIPLIVALKARWRFFRASLEAHLLDGSYSYTEEKFFGNQRIPPIDMRGPSPGDCWEEMKHPPDLSTKGYGLVILREGDVRNELLRRHGDTLIPDLV